MAIFYRTFKNMDVGGLCHVWNRSGYVNVWGEKVDDRAFDQFIASKLIFDPAHLIVAVEPLETPDPAGLSDGRIVGFVHGGFGPNKEMNGCDRTVGYVAMLAVEQREEQQEIRTRLLFEMEKVFFRMGIRTVFVGAVYPNAPFYLGRLFGCELNGILENDRFLPQILLKNHYIGVERYHALTFHLQDCIHLNFHDRRIYQNCEVITSDKIYSQCESGQEHQEITNLIPQNWWESCAYVGLECNWFVLLNHVTNAPIAWVGSRILSRDKNSTIIGLHNLYVVPECRNQGYAKLFLKLVLREFQKNYGDCSVDLLVPEINVPAIRTFNELHFTMRSTGNVYRRTLPEDFLEVEKSSND